MLFLFSLLRSIAVTTAVKKSSSNKWFCCCCSFKLLLLRSIGVAVMVAQLAKKKICCWCCSCFRCCGQLLSLWQLKNHCPTNDSIAAVLFNCCRCGRLVLLRQWNNWQRNFFCWCCSSFCFCHQLMWLHCQTNNSVAALFQFLSRWSICIAATIKQP